MIRDFIEVFRKPSVDVIAQRQLDDARRSLMNAHESLEYAKAMVQFNEERIKRLKQTIKDGSQ
jgi:anti-sigma28 factor (negative regulator of flagellin synthesis)